MVRLRDRGAGRGAEESADAAEIKCLITASQVNFISSQAEDRYLSLDYVNSARLVYVIQLCRKFARLAYAIASCIENLLTCKHDAFVSDICRMAEQLQSL